MAQKGLTAARLERLLNMAKLGESGERDVARDTLTKAGYDWQTGKPLGPKPNYKSGTNASKMEDLMNGFNEKFGNRMKQNFEFEKDSSSPFDTDPFFNEKLRIPCKSEWEKTVIGIIAHRLFYKVNVVFYPMSEYVTISGFSENQITIVRNAAKRNMATILKLIETKIAEIIYNAPLN